MGLELRLYTKYIASSKQAIDDLEFTSLLI